MVGGQSKRGAANRMWWWLICFFADWMSSTKAGCQVLTVGMGQMSHREDPGALREGEGLL